ncbi:hypothetical protein CAPTEDRAFT_223806 [Capitella teleta]|uniref:Uncharacterized protein n=1 Tax=Capitella teleta TaxID=283909 RepID=R7UVZ8_CAPTE|nr:hypothetical protein CAPTEDRAFT_223806 [Capitella teleta]|eukprot:ELU10504.1 hypothetical protein CAPTEDRAFT_223806 [Capitella teleta]
MEPRLPRQKPNKDPGEKPEELHAIGEELGVDGGVDIVLNKKLLEAHAAAEALVRQLKQAQKIQKPARKPAQKMRVRLNPARDELGMVVDRPPRKRKKKAPKSKAPDAVIEHPSVHEPPSQPGSSEHPSFQAVSRASQDKTKIAATSLEKRKV